MPDLVGAPTRAQRETEGVDDERLAAPGLARQEVEAGPEANARLGHQREVPDVELLKQCPSLQRDQRPAPTQLLGQPLVEALRRAEPHHLQTPRQRAAAQHVTGLHGATTPATVDA